MTDPRGCTFLSYRRVRKGEVALLISALNDLGIPTWQDIRNLDEEHTEEELRRTLRDPATASAILWLTPEVADSQVIQRIELPDIFARAKERDGFFIIPVAAGGLDYEQATQVVDPHFTSEDLSEWNLRKVDMDPIGPTEAAAIASRALVRRIEAICSASPTREPLRLGLYTRAHPQFPVGEALTLNWTGRFIGREATGETWDNYLLPALRAIVETLHAKAPERRIEAAGLPAIPAALALGAAFLAPRGIHISWRQKTPGHAERLWSIDVPREPSGFEVAMQGSQVQAEDVAVLASIASDVEPAFRQSKHSLPPFRVILRVTKSGGTTHILSTPGQAVDVAHIIVEGIRKARVEYCPRGWVHLFMALPVGLAMLVGQLLNTLGPVQTYEHIPANAVGFYRPAALLNPSI